MSTLTLISLTKVRAEGTGSNPPYPFSTMSKVTYRGQSYDTAQTHQVQPTEGVFTYRGKTYIRGLNELALIKKQAEKAARQYEASLASLKA
jgi:hypothetical protein